MLIPQVRMFVVMSALAAASYTMSARAFPTFVMVRGGALEKPVVIWHTREPEIREDMTAARAIYEGSFSSETPCTLADGPVYDVAVWWFGRDTPEPVGKAPPDSLSYRPDLRIAVVSIRNGDYCWVPADAGTSAVKAGTAGVLLPKMSVDVLRKVGVR
jgi:hypothetical protein